MSTAAPARSSHVLVASCAAAEPRFPMIEWSVIAPSPMFWRLNVELTFADVKKIAVAVAPDERDAPERLIIVTFQSQSATLAEDAKEANESDATAAVVPRDDAKPAAGETFMYSPAVAEWKDLCRENVVAFSKAVRAKLTELAGPASEEHEGQQQQQRWWFDAVDPATGQPLESAAGPSLYSESDAIELLLKLPVVSVGVGNSVCRLVQHPRHGLDVYPSSLFYIGPRALLVEALATLGRR